MSAFNVVRFRVKPGIEKAFEDGHRDAHAMPGGVKAVLIKTGDRDYCLVGEWNSMSDIVAARPSMIGTLDKFRSMLEELPSGTGVTDAVSGEVVVDMR